MTDSISDRYDAVAAEYDATVGEFANLAGVELLALLGTGPGRCLDLGCGTGINLERLTSAGWTVIGVDVSAGQLRVATALAVPGVELVLADAAHLPFDDRSFDAVACSLLHTDLEDRAAVWSEAARVIRPGGKLAYVGTHPCFVAPFARNVAGRPPELHPGYRAIGWTTEGPGIGDGIRRRVGVRHVPLADFLNEFLEAGFRITRVSESGGDDFPLRIGVLALR